MWGLSKSLSHAQVLHCRVGVPAGNQNGALESNIRRGRICTALDTFSFVGPLCVTGIHAQLIPVRNVYLEERMFPLTMDIEASQADTDEITGCVVFPRGR